MVGGGHSIWISGGAGKPELVEEAPEERLSCRFEESKAQHQRKKRKPTGFSMASTTWMQESSESIVSMIFALEEPRTTEPSGVPPMPKTPPVIEGSTRTEPPNVTTPPEFRSASRETRSSTTW